MTISIKRAYEPPQPTDGYRVLVDRIWPRGLKKEDAHIQEWAKDLAPTDELRKWFHRNDSRWQEFQERYRAELREQGDRVAALAARARQGKVTLVFASRNQDCNNASVLRDCIEEQLSAGK